MIFRFYFFNDLKQAWKYLSEHYTSEVYLGACIYRLFFTADFFPQVTEIANGALILNCGCSFQRHLLGTELWKIIQSSFGFILAKDTRGSMVLRPVLYFCLWFSHFIGSVNSDHMKADSSHSCGFNSSWAFSYFVQKPAEKASFLSTLSEPGR